MFGRCGEIDLFSFPKLDALVMLETAKLLSVNPIVGFIESFVDAETISRLEADLSKMDLGPAEVASATGPVQDSKRIALTRKILPSQSEQIDKLLDRVAAVFQMKSELCEHPEFISYQAGGEFKRHFDAGLGGVMPNPNPDQFEPSQRVFTAVLYLNDDFTAGETVFPRLDVTIKPKSGRLVFWQNTNIGSLKVHPMSMHQGAPVEDGNKRIVSFWFRNRPWRPALS
ncbi:prolyl hydroxylase family protein [Shimia sp. SK013]|uniref:prolyl hydroxylase family protein n=1 Tax=Shimia sp. SK013 TaxID=1389006 RepID=UPI0006B66536|nr:2OG-Fe(II) oxygenase [Shimia sp. SK013]